MAKNSAIIYELLYDACEQGHAYAQYSIALKLYNAANFDHRNTDINTVIYYYELASRQGLADASSALSKLYIDGDFIDKNVKKAAQYLKLAAEQGNIDAMVEYSKALIAGNWFDEEIETNISQAFMWLTKASRYDHPEGTFFLGKMYLAGLSVEKNDQKAKELFQKADDLGY